MLLHEGVDELVALEKTTATALRRIFVERGDGIGFYTGVPDGKGDGFGGVRTKIYGRGVVGQKCHGHGFLPFRYGIKNRTCDMAVDVLYALEFQCQIAIVPGLVGGLDMQIDKVVGAQGLKGSTCLAGIVGIPQAWSPIIATFFPDN